MQTTNLTENESAVREISQKVMQGVAVLIRQSHRRVTDYKQATQAIRDEVKAFLFGAEYADERVCLLRRSVPQSAIVASVCLGAFQKINFN